MKNALKIGFIFLFLYSNLWGQSTKHVLFLGNSYTGVNNLASIVASLAQSTNNTLTYSKNTPGGSTLQGHSTNPTSLALIQQGNWDYVVLQEQSQVPSWPISQVATQMFPYADSLCKRIRQANSCTVPMFFMTWGREDGDSYNCPNWPPVCTYEGMDSLLNLRYRMVADSNDAYVSPVGAVWHYIRDNNPQIKLYSSDGSHPSLAGSYAAACTFYTMIFQKNPKLITNDYGLDASDANFIRNAAKIIAYDSLYKWNIGKYLPEANFSSLQQNDSVYFTNSSLYSDSYTWDFGDGSTSTDVNPIHHYTQTGNYTVMLKAEKCMKKDTISQQIQIILSSINEAGKSEPYIFPNPIQNKLNIQLSSIETVNNIQIYSMDGKLMSNYPTITDQLIQLNTNDLKAGVYLLRFEIDNKVYRYKIQK
ncbi:MAG: hypothetical protein DSY76_01960 [Bacteroidetes bacterium]|nr:MAG: hypothetical protein DSY76_01960 [Bacteroidota bacterium]